MNKLFENSILVKLQDWGQKIGSNKFLSALQGAMMSCTGLLMVSAVSIVICNIGTMFDLIQNGDSVYNILYTPYNYTMGFLGIWVVVFMAFNYSKSLKIKSPLMSAVNSAVCFALVAGPISANEFGVNQVDMTYLGAQGMFIGFIVVGITINIEKFCIKKDVRIKLPESVPQYLQDGFTSILPLLFSAIVFLTISTAVTMTTDGVYNVCSGFMALIGLPLGVLVSVPGMFVLCFLASLMWCFGIHGSMILLSVLYPVMMQTSAANIAAYQAGGVDALAFYPVFLFSALNMCGGTGNTIGLALLGAKSKSKQISSVSKISLVPGVFGVNEPLAFGLPIMYNPILCIPYILNVQVVCLLLYLAYHTGFIIPAFIPIMTQLPIGITEYVGTLNWKNSLFTYLMIPVTTLIYYPFFKIYEKQCLAKERNDEA